MSSRSPHSRRSSHSRRSPHSPQSPTGSGKTDEEELLSNTTKSPSPPHVTRKRPRSPRSPSFLTKGELKAINERDFKNYQDHLRRSKKNDEAAAKQKQRLQAQQEKWLREDEEEEAKLKADKEKKQKNAEFYSEVHKKYNDDNNIFMREMQEMRERKYDVEQKKRAEEESRKPRRVPIITKEQKQINVESTFKKSNIRSLATNLGKPDRVEVKTKTVDLGPAQRVLKKRGGKKTRRRRR